MMTGLTTVPLLEFLEHDHIQKGVLCNHSFSYSESGMFHLTNKIQLPLRLRKTRNMHFGDEVATPTHAWASASESMGVS